MKLKTLLEYQRCFDMMRDLTSGFLSGKDYIDALRASSVFDAELAERLKPINLEITNEIRNQD
jgi:hypothetical protein